MRPTRLAGATAAFGLGGAGALHAIWTFSPWPLASRGDFARKVVGVAEADLPTAGLTATVAAALGSAAYLVAAQARLVPQIGPRRLTRLGVRVTAGLLLVCVARPAWFPLAVPVRQPTTRAGTWRCTPRCAWLSAA